MLPTSISQKWRKELNKRVNQNIDPLKVQTFPWFEMIRKILHLRGDFWVFWSERMHDYYFHLKLSKEDFDIFIGSEKSSLRCFRMAKRRNKITILDLAQVHYREIMRLRDRHITLDNGLVSGKKLSYINKIKEKELQSADYIFTLSEFAKHSLIQGGISPDRIRLLSLGFEPTQFNLKTYKKKKDFRLLFVGPITKKKGVELICKAVDEINISNIKVTFIGTPSDGMNTLERYKQFIEYHSFQPHSVLARFYQEADVFVFPSFLDSWGMVVLEAMACGTPVIVSENTGAKDVVLQGGGAVIPFDLEALKEKILFFYNNPDQLETLGREAHQLSQRYTWQNYHSQVQNTVEEIYRSTLKE